MVFYRAKGEAFLIIAWTPAFSEDVEQLRHSLAAYIAGIQGD